MIVKMAKLLIASSVADRDRLLAVLRDIGVVHIIPVDPATAVADEKTKSKLDIIARAIQQLHQYEPDGDAPDMTPEQAATETLAIVRQSVEGQNRLTTLYHHIQELDMWGDLKLENMAVLQQAGVEPEFYIIPTKDLAEVQAEFVTELAGVKEKTHTLIAVIDRTGQATLPDSAVALELPAKDRPTLRAEAAAIDAALKADDMELSQLANLLPALEAERDKLESHSEFTAAINSGLHEDTLYAVQGWVPADKATGLAESLESAGVQAAVEAIEPGEDETPPTLIKYAKWVRPIKALFDILATFPGYREIELSPFFVIALPLFAAMLIGDAGYGLIFALAGLAFRKKLAVQGDNSNSNLLILIGVFTIIWGTLSANFFGITPDTFAKSHGWVTTVVKQGSEVEITDVAKVQAATGPAATITKAMLAVAPIWRADGEEGRNLLIKISFVIACIHLVLAHIRKMFDYGRSLLSLAELGWCIVLIAMFLITWNLLFSKPLHIPAWIVYMLAVGILLPTLFSMPHKNPLVRVLGGFASSLLPTISTFSDTMSYIRLMAVGLASYYIAFAFNDLASDLASVATWAAGIPVLLFGHGLNIGLCIIAIFAHGVRLNMLEFSNNVGVQWAGHAYQPFANKLKQEN